MTFNQFLKSCPKNGNFYLLENIPNLIFLRKPQKNWVASNRTNVHILVFNKETEMTSRKSVYVNSKFEFYLKIPEAKKGKQMLFLKDFK